MKEQSVLRINFKTVASEQLLMITFNIIFHQSMKLMYNIGSTSTPVHKVNWASELEELVTSKKRTPNES